MRERMNENERHSRLWDTVHVRSLATALLLLLMCGYLLQAASPLRINTDAYRLLSMAVSAHHQEGYLVDGQPDQYPLLYPFLIKVMLDLNVASSASIIILNLVCLLVALCVLYVWCKPDFGSMGAMLAITCVLCSWVMVKHVTLPLTEMLYLAISSLSLLSISNFWGRGRGKWWFFAVAALLGFAAMQVRTIGITLLLVVVLSALFHQDNAPIFARIVANRRHRWVIVTCAFAITILIGIALFAIQKTTWFESQFLRSGGYWQSLIRDYKNDGIAQVLTRNIGYRIREFGEIFSNIPSSKATFLRPLQDLLGLIAWCGIAYGAWVLLRSRRLMFIPFYFLSYIAVMFWWPWYDSRFWLPLLPVLAVLALTSIGKLVAKWSSFRAVTYLYLCGFVVLGVSAILFSTRISLSGRNFSEYYGDGTTRMMYRYAFQNGMEIDMAQVDEKWVRLLEVFEPLTYVTAAQTDGQQPHPPD